MSNFNLDQSLNAKSNDNNFKVNDIAMMKALASNITSNEILANTPSSPSVIFVDSRVKDSAALLKNIPNGTEVIILNHNTDGLQQIANYLSGKQVASIQLVAHGFESQLWLGSSFLDNATLSNFKDSLAKIGEALTPDGDILIYSCDLAAGEDGLEFVNDLANFTGADIAASNNRTGLNGDWELEITTGNIEAKSALSQDAIASYEHALATLTVTTNADSGAGSLRNQIAAATSGDTIAFNANMSITLSTGQLQISKNLTIQGDRDANGTADVTIDANYTSRVLSITTGTVTLDGLIIQHGLLSGNGGDYDSLNGKDALGAGISITGGTVTIKNSSITANVAAGGGGNGGGSGYGYGGGGGGGFSSKGGARGGNYNAAYLGLAGGGGAGGRGGYKTTYVGGAAQTGKGGSTIAGAGGTAASGLSSGGNGGRAGSASTGYIGGGGAGAGGSMASAVGRGGDAAGGIYIASGATVFIASSSITNNLGAGGGGAGSNGMTGGSAVNGAAGGIGVGGILNKGSLSYSNASVTTSNNYGAGGAGGGSQGTNTGGTSGSGSNAGTESFVTTGSGTTDSNWGPSITSATYDANSGTLVVTGANMTNGGTIDVTKLSLAGQGGTYTLTAATSNPTTSSATSFTVTLGAADKIAVNGVLNKSGTSSATGGITFNLAAAANWDVTAAAAADLTGNGVTVSNVTAPTITSASYDASTGILSVTGTGLVRTIGANNDITVNQLRIVGEGGTGRTLIISSNVEITDASTFAVQLSGNDRIIVDSLLNKNGTSSTSGSTYNLAAFDGWNSDITGGDISDATSALTVVNVPVPTITSATYDATTGSLVVTGTGFLQLTGANNDIVANKFTFTGEGGSTYALTDTSNVDIATTSNTQFTLVLSATDKSGVNQIINKSGTSSTGGTTYNIAAAEDWAAGADAAVVVADLTGNGVTATVAAPTVTSATYDASSGTLVVTGTGFTHRAGAGNDIIANKFTLTGQGGSTYALTDTANVEITSDTSFTLVLSTTDKAGLRTLLNNNGTQSVGGTTYNLAAADDWANGTDAALNIADTTGNGITVSNVVSPTITSATYDAGTGILTVTGTNMASGDAIDVTKLTLTGQGGSYTLTAATANVTASSATSFSVSLGAADKIAVNGVLNNNGTNAVDTTTFNLEAAANWDTTVTTSADLTGNAVTVTNVVAPTITSATYDGSSNVLVVTGTGLVKTIGANNDITVSKLTITGDGGSTYTLSTTGNVEITSATSFSLTLTGADIAGVNALLNKNGTSSAASATTYNIAAADDWNSVITGGDISDLTSNGITVANAAPTIISSTYDASTGTLVVTGANMVTGDTIDVSKLSIAGQGGSYTLTSPNVTAASATSFTVTLNAVDQLNINGILNKNGSSAVDTTTFNLAAAASWDASRTTSADLSGNAITVSNVVTPTITSATFDGSSNLLVVTGTGLVKTIGANNDITISKLTITGEGGATYTLSTSSNVEVTSATSFSLTLSGADIAGVNNLLNKNGTSSISSTTYNLAAADDWNSVITSGNIADLTGNGITVSNAAPTIVNSTYDASTGTLVVTGANMVTGDTIDVSKLSIAGQGGSYTLTSPNVTAASATTFTVTLNAADKLAINGILNQNGSSAVDTTNFNLAAAASWDASRTSSADLTGNGITVSNVAAPTISAATFDGTTNVLTVTGTGLVRTLGATNDITISKLTITGEGGATYTLSTSGNVEITSATSFNITLSGADTGGVSALLNKNGTSSAVSATAYNIAAADDWNSVITGGNIADLTGNAITVSNAAPNILNATYDAATGILSVSAVNIFSGDTIDVSKLSLIGEAGGSYTLTSPNVTASSATAFSVTLNAADKLAINGLLNKNGTSAVDTTSFNLAAAASWNASTTSNADLTGNAVTVSNVTAPTITSATYDVTTHILTVTGTGLVKTLGATNDVTISTLTITGEGGATRTLSTTGNVEITSATSFAVTLAGADQTAVEALFNKNGTTSTNGTTYNLAASDDWNSVITGGNIADVSSPITVTNVPVPTITSSTYDAITGVLTVTGTGFASLTGANNDIVANKFSLQGEGGASYTLTNTSNVEINSATSFTLTLSAADRLGANLIMNKNGTSSTSANTYNLIAAEDWNAGADVALTIADLTGNGVTVSNVVAPTVTSATYNVATGVLVVTGNNFLSLTGANNDITANRVRFLGQGAFNYTLTDTSNVDITSNTSFTMTMSANDKAALALRLNKDGTSSTDSTTYNIGMLEDWNAGAASAVVIADLFSNAVTVTGNNVAPVIGGALAGQTVNQGSTLNPFASITITDPDVGASETVTI
ncbi:DUF4347 domain-containing protein, partial [Undibacterium baiyunense]